ncbi:metallophosphoesterase [Helicobacter suis]|uniref:Metallophosphoesterase n=1 Tax=Helicobacter suis HS5 TaxID=710394 RepID=E7G567_9HELI|nr:metallophosphoesterase [Helicobacter suis]EFX41481.1 metallophosphoesterase [Helicobacter suis HS5]
MKFYNPAMAYLIFYSVFIVFLGLTNLYVYKKLLQKMVLLQYVGGLAGFMVLGLFIAQLVFLFASTSSRLHLGTSIYKILSLSYAPTYVLFGITLLFECLNIALALIGKPHKSHSPYLFFLYTYGIVCILIFLLFIGIYKAIFKASQFNLDISLLDYVNVLAFAALVSLALINKQEIKNQFYPLFDLAFLVLVIYFSAIIAHNALEIPAIKKVKVIIPGLKQDLKIAMLTDVHLGPNLHEKFLNRIIQKVNAQRVDMVVIVGDLVDTNPKNLEGYISKLDDLKSTYGTFYAVGNHEYYHGLSSVLNLLKTHTHMKILFNSSVDMGPLNIAGLADLAGLRWGGEYAPSLPKTTKHLNKDKPSILLTHEPRAALIYDLKDFDLVLSGHTHGGQVFPFMFLAKWRQGFIHGLYSLSPKTKIYVSSGVGFWGPAMRAFAKSEIVILNLKRK